MLPVYVMVFQLGSLFSDFEIIMKIAGLLFIVSFVRQHIQDPLLSNIVILGLSAFLLFDVWKIFGSALFLYILVSFGVLHTVVDLSFLGAFQRKPSKEDQQRAAVAQQRQAEAQQEEQGYRRQPEYEEMGGEEEDSHGHSNTSKFLESKKHGGAHASAKHQSLSHISPQQLQQMMRGGQGGGHGGGGRH